MRFPLSRPDMKRYDGYRQRAGDDSGGLIANFLGTSSVLLSDGETKLLCDGFVTRPGLAKILFSQISPDRALVRAAIERLQAERLAAVFCAHTHYDHALDAPCWSLETGAEFVGSPSTANVGRGLGVPDRLLRVVADGDTVSYGRFELTFLGSVHSPGDRFPGTVEQPLVPPARAGDWKTGTAYCVLISHPRGRILVHASANYRPGMLSGRRADVVYLGVGALGKQPADFVDAYWNEVVRATGARRVILVHWDDFFIGLDKPLRPMRRAADRFDVTMARISTLARTDGVDLVLPVAWEPTHPLDGLDVKAEQ